MQLSATLTIDDLRSVIDEIKPLRVEIRPRRVITLGRPTMVELVAGAGLRVRGDARFTWEVGALPIPVKLRAWQVLLVPSFVATKGGGHVLAFEPVLEELDFKRVPLFVESRIAEAMKQGLAAQKHQLIWDFAKHLTFRFRAARDAAPASLRADAPPSSRSAAAR